MAWTTSPVERAEGAGMLARAFLYGDLAEPEREEARLVLTGLTIPEVLWAAGPFEAGESLTVYEAAMVYSGRHPGGVRGLHN
jgi:hypothetical protein